MTGNIKERLSKVSVAAPCPANWTDMQGDDKIRYCSLCNLKVHNTASMTDEEVLLLVSEAAGGKRVCAALYQREDGTLLTRNCPVGLNLLRMRAKQAASWVAGILAFLISSAVHAAPAQTKDAQQQAKKPCWSGKIHGAGFGLRGLVGGAKATAPAAAGRQYRVRMGQIVVNEDTPVLITPGTNAPHQEQGPELPKQPAKPQPSKLSEPVKATPPEVQPDKT